MTVDLGHEPAGGRAEASELELELDRRPPATLTAGCPTAIFLKGRCSHPSAPIRRLDLLVDGTAHRPAGWVPPSFWTVLPIDGRAHSRPVELQVRARLADGSEAAAPLGRISLAEPRRPAGRARDEARTSDSRRAQDPARELVAICMATFEPDMELFDRQVDSLRAQTDRDWICLVSDDCSRPECFEEIELTLAGDPRFVVSRSDRRQGFYRNFERALEMVPPEARLIALCDQDDRWYPKKLELLRRALGSARLVYSDQRLVDARGSVLRDTLWSGRSNNHTDLASLLVANTITGAATLFRREVAELALPFPDPPGWQFHDQWIGLVALASGEIAYVDRPLYDYVQHSGAIFGDVSPGANRPDRHRRSWARPRISRWRGLATRGRAAYFYGYVGRELLARTLLARCPGMSAPKHRVLARFVAIPRSPIAFAWLASRPLRALRGRSETLGSETELALGILWRWLAGARARLAQARRTGAPDTRLPPLESFEQRRLRRWRAGV